jgi:Flp pilus assembly protein protease CpaA
MLIAAYCDLRWRRLPNRLMLMIFGAGLLSQIFIWGIGGVQTAIVGALLGALTMGPLFLLGWVGGGDVKLAIAMGAWLGPHATLEAVLGGFIGGVPLGLIWMTAVRVKPERREQEFWRYLPLGVPLSLAAIWVSLRGLVYV